MTILRTRGVHCIIVILSFSSFFCSLSFSFSLSLFSLPPLARYPVYYSIVLYYTHYTDKIRRRPRMVQPQSQQSFEFKYEVSYIDIPFIILPFDTVFRSIWRRGLLLRSIGSSKTANKGETYNVYGGVDLSDVSTEAVVGFCASGTPIVARPLASVWIRTERKDESLSKRGRVKSRHTAALRLRSIFFLIELFLSQGFHFAGRFAD